MWIFKSDLSNNRFLNEKSEYSLEYLSQIKKEYDNVKNKSFTELSFSDFIQFQKTGERLSYENEYFARRSALRDFALMSWLYDDETAIEKLENVMWAVCNEFTWVLPAHIGENIFNETIDLFAAETAQTLSEIISLLKDKLSGVVIKRCLSEINRRVLKPFINRTEPYNWEKMNSNWCAVCGGCIGMTAIYLIEDDLLLKTVIDDLKPVMNRYIESFSDDGACLEGLYYWNYGMMYFTAFIDLYMQRTKSSFPVDMEKICKIADFAHKCCMGKGFTISFSDGYERDKIYSGLSSRLNDIFGSHTAVEEYLALFEGDECGRWCKAVRDIAWTKKLKKSEELKNVVLPEAQWAVMHSDDISIALKGGRNNEPHNHNDIGSIMLVKGGEIVLCDLGAGEYTSDYFSDNRYNIFCNRSAGHGVPIINGEEQKAGSEFKAENFLCDNVSVSFDISGAYGIAKLKECMRTVFCDNNITVIKDDFVFDGSFEVTERFITRHRAVLEKDCVKIISHERCIARMKTDNICSIEISTYEHREHNGANTEITAIDFKFTAENTYKFKVKIL